MDKLAPEILYQILSEIHWYYQHPLELVCKSWREWILKNRVRARFEARQFRNSDYSAAIGPSFATHRAMSSVLFTFGKGGKDLSFCFPPMDNLDEYFDEEDYLEYCKLNGLNSKDQTPLDPAQSVLEHATLPQEKLQEPPKEPLVLPQDHPCWDEPVCLPPQSSIRINFNGWDPIESGIPCEFPLRVIGRPDVTVGDAFNGMVIFFQREYNIESVNRLTGYQCMNWTEGNNFCNRELR